MIDILIQKSLLDLIDYISHNTSVQIFLKNKARKFEIEPTIPADPACAAIFLDKLI